MSELLRKGMLFGMGNPLLDISATVDEDFLKKYDLKPNNAILAEEKHLELYKELVEKYDVSYIAGGSTQNSFRVLQWIVQQPNIATFMGCIGRDKFGGILEQIARESGLNVRYQYSDQQPTGTCAVLITKNGSCRSLCANLAAANCFTIDHLKKPENFSFVEEASYFYVSSFFLTVSIESVLLVAEHALSKNKVFSMNLSAPFLCTAYRDNMMKAFPYIDLLFGNDEEARTFAEEHKLGVTDIKDIAKKISEFPKKNTNVQRMIVITQGENPVIVVEDGICKEYDVIKLQNEEIVDTNGAGDAFVGGFLAMYILKKPVEICLKYAVKVATEVIKESGCTLPDRQSFKVV